MIASKIKRYFIQKKIHKLVADHQLESAESRNCKIKTVGLLTEQKISEDFNLRGIVTDFLLVDDLTICSFDRKNNKKDKKPESFIEADLDWKAEIKDDYLKTFKDSQFDILICLYSNSETIVDYIAYSSKAKFKVGLASKRTQFFDLEIHLETFEVNKYFTELQKYLKILSKL